MSGSFAALMKLSQSQTAQSELAVQSQIATHQVQLEKKRREQEARERKERELEAKIRAKRFEEERKEEERQRKREAEERARELELAKREEQMRDALKYGPRKTTSGSSSRSRGGSDKDVDRDAQGGPAFTREELRGRQSNNTPDVLTREEKRERKLAAELRRSAASSSSRRSGGGSGRTTSLPDGRTVRRLPGGAVDYTTVSRLADPDATPTPALSTGKSARERLAAMPSTLTKLNTVKRDLRTIDEILVDRAKARQAKTLAGDEAKEFSDWFGKKKKEPQPQSQSQSQSQPQQQSQKTGSFSSSRAASAVPTSAPGSPSPPINPFAGTKPGRAKPATPAPPKPSGSFLKSINPKSSAVPTLSRTSSAVASSTLSKKRPRSPSNASPPPPKRRAPAPSRSRQAVDIGAEIWSIFGKDKKSYLARDILSDDEEDDMEADAESVLKEEMRSTRLAHKEDEVALAEERRHEEEKRRRRKERGRKERG